MITLIGSKLAKVGMEFVFVNPASECEACKLKNNCVNLEAGRRYRIAGIREESHDCPLHDGGVVAVEVSETPVIAAIDSRRAHDGSKFFFECPRCDHTACSIRESCFPSGMRKGDGVTITRVVANGVDCEIGRTLKIVELKRSTD